MFIYDEIKLVKYLTVQDYHYSNLGRFSCLLQIDGLMLIFLEASHVPATCKIEWEKEKNLVFCVKRKTEKKKTINSAELQVDWPVTSSLMATKRVLMFDSQCSSLTHRIPLFNRREKGISLYQNKWRCTTEING